MSQVLLLNYDFLHTYTVIEEASLVPCLSCGESSSALHKRDWVGGYPLYVVESLGWLSTRETASCIACCNVSVMYNNYELGNYPCISMLDERVPVQEEKAESSHYIHVYSSSPAGEILVQGSSSPPSQGEFSIPIRVQTIMPAILIV